MNLRLKAGSYFAYALSGKNKVKEYYEVEIDEYEYDLFDDSEYDDGEISTSRFDCGLVLGADVEYHRFVVGAEFEYGFIPVAKNDLAMSKNCVNEKTGFSYHLLYLDSVFKYIDKLVHNQAPNYELVVSISFQIPSKTGKRFSWRHHQKKRKVF